MMSSKLNAALTAVCDQESFLRFVEALCADRQNVETMAQTPDGFRGEWANQTIGDFLEAALAWAHDSECGASLATKETNPWRQCAFFLMAGREYE